MDTSTYETTLAGSRRERFGYGLDSVGSRVGAGMAYRYEHLVDPDGLSGWLQIAGRYDRAVNARNEIAEEDSPGQSLITLTRDEIGSVTMESGGAETRTQAYDAWGRLALWSYYDPGAGGGPHFGQYNYDALGRLYKRNAPWPTQPSLSRVETYYHDGVRRIQEVFTDPVHGETPWADPFGTPPPAQTPQTRMEREYIWAAHETAGVNELHVAIDWFDREAWAIQDAHNQTVMGYADAAGDLVEQRVYTPFGQVLNADKTALANPGGLYNDFRLRLGHHGLFADRLDADTTQPVLRHADARVICLTDNRVYEPLRGSWMQRDPFATGILSATNMGWGGVTSGSGLDAFNTGFHYTDGLNPFPGVRGNAVEFTDPAGLFALIDVSVTSAGRAAGKGYQAYDTVDGIVGMAKALQSGMGAQQMLLMIAADVVFDKAGGKLFDKSLTKFRSLQRQMSKNGPRGKKMPRDIEAGPADSFVYIGMDTKSSEAVYVGITNDLKRRRREHGGKYRLVPVAGPIPRQAARVLEQALIAGRGLTSLDNKRNEISPSHDWYEGAMDWALDYMSQIP